MKIGRSAIADGRPLAAGAPMLALMLVLTFCTGCPKRQSSMGRPPEVNPPPKVEASASARLDELDELSRRFEATAQRLPGGTPDEHRQIVQQVFAELAQLLPVLYGPNPAGPFRQQLRIVESSRTQLASGPKGLAVEPTVDTGLRAAHDALASLSSRAYFDQAQLGQTMDRLAATLARLDTARGPAHQGVVAEAVSLTAGAIRQMSDALIRRLGAERGAQEARPSGAQAPSGAGVNAARN
jgi:hypothetical protein